MIFWGCMPPCLRKFYTLLPNNAQFKHLSVENAKGLKLCILRSPNANYSWARGCPLTTSKNQDQAMYVRTSFRGAKSCKIGKKCVAVFTNFGKDMMKKLRKKKKKKETCKNAELGSIFHTWKIRA